MAEVAVSHLTRAFSARSPAGLFDLTLAIPANEILAVVGPSGAGKTTLLRLIAGLERPDSGAITIAGRDVTWLPPHERDLGMVAQRVAIYPHLGVRRNVSIGLEMWNGRHRRQRIARDEMNRRVDEAIQLLDLAPLLDRRPYDLSGGEQQRVALGRLLVRRPGVWLLDEPLSHLDAARKMEFRGYLHLLRARCPTTIILVTHDPVEALALGQRLAVLDAGRLRQVDTPAAMYARPADRLVAGLIGWPPLNLADGVLVRADQPGGGLLFAAADGTFHLPVPAELATHGAEGQPVTLGIRPEEVSPAAATPSLTADLLTLPDWRVGPAEFVPPRWLVSARTGRCCWRLWHPGPPPAPGGRIDLSFQATALHWFDGKSGKRLSGEPGT